MTLHQIQTASESVLAELALFIDDQDAVLLLGRAACMAELVSTMLDGANLLVRQSDADACGVAPSESAEFDTISDQQWVELTLSHTKTITWK